jgi:hypothetical protein
MAGEKIEVENINRPGRTTRVDAAKYRAMKAALLAALDGAEQGLTQFEMREAVRPHLPEELFPGGEKRGWWAKSVQLDLEAKKVIVRDGAKPLRWRVL